MKKALRRIRKRYARAGLTGFYWTLHGKLTGSQRLVTVRGPGIRFPFRIRVPSTDEPTYEEVFNRPDYRFDALRAPAVIVDAGANVGLTSILFANRFPGARILAIEPERGNYELLERNVEPYRNVTPIRAALWSENGTVSLVDPGNGSWGFMTEAGADGERVKACTLDAVMREHGVERVDVLKVDIEGAEAEVFADPSAWIDRVDSIVIELHDRFKEGCGRAFRAASAGFDREWMSGNSVYVSRHGMLAPADGASSDVAN